MASSDIKSDIKLELEIRMYLIEPNETKQWWQFWKPNEIRRLINNPEAPAPSSDRSET